MKLLISSIYNRPLEEIPQACVKRIRRHNWIGNPIDFDICEQGPEHPEYYKAWKNVLNNATNENKQKLHQREDGCVEVWDEDEDPNQEYDNWGDEIILITPKEIADLET